MSNLTVDARHAYRIPPSRWWGHNAFTQDPVLVEALERDGTRWAHDHCAGFGAIVGSERVGEECRGVRTILESAD